MTYKVLIVDDSKLARMAAAKMLRECRPGWTTIEAGSAAQAVDTLAQEAPDIALVDFNMPERDGLDLAAELRAHRPAMPIALVSANHQQPIVERARALGATFLPKPISAQSLGGFLDAAMQTLESAPR